ncbi:hypothetical protein DQ384_25900 [Sphaerisporangium album]|uniref:Uncharacterized protein n=1 Tax=Sphaerisporangium album TaxID=509200 RepID=A0A367FC68_9ACTN|nr:hypothetical protein DQ384_25900 [Sphaerisporangium album]
MRPGGTAAGRAGASARPSAEGRGPGAMGGVGRSGVAPGGPPGGGVVTTLVPAFPRCPGGPRGRRARRRPPVSGRT